MQDFNATKVSQSKEATHFARFVYPTTFENVVKEEKW